MAGINKVILIGNLGRDPEMRYTQNNTAVANFTLATSDQWTDRNGEKQERTEWHRIVAWGRLAEICGQYLQKGRQVYIEGRLQTREWTDQNGQKRYTTEIVAREMQMLGRPGDAPAQMAASSGGGGAQASGPATDDFPPAPPAGGEDDDLPF